MIYVLWIVLLLLIGHAAGMEYAGDGLAAAGSACHDFLFGRRRVPVLSLSVPGVARVCIVVCKMCPPPRL